MEINKLFSKEIECLLVLLLSIGIGIAIPLSSSIDIAIAILFPQNIVIGIAILLVRIANKPDSHTKVPPLFDTIAGFTSQGLGLPAYACKSDNSTAIKLASRMYQNLPF